MSEGDTVTEASKEAPPKRTARASGGGAARARAGVAAVRSRLATVVWLAAVVCALFLAVGALLTALKANPENPVVDFVLNGANTLDGPFSLRNGIFTFPRDEDGLVRSALTNWGIAAVVYLVVGKLLDRIIRP